MSDGNDDRRAPSHAAPSPADPTLTREPDSEVLTPPAAPPADPGPVPAGHPDRYELLAEHGRGGLGRVSRAHDRMLGRDVAIKELISRGPINEVRFLREALITARLEHPGIVPIHEAGRWPDGTPYYAMKLVAGRSLRDLLAERTTVDERLALLDHVIAVADAIAYAHGRKIIHRDLKPANIIVGDFGETVVIDWGLAKDLGEADPLDRGGFQPPSPDDGLTSAGTILGTPAYMAPEQERGDPVDQRADVFAIGAMLWELCSLQRQPPTDAGQRRRALRRAGIDEDLIAIIHQALDPDPARRYPDAGALAADLKAFTSGARIAARRYSLPALLAHWTRRHRVFAVSAAIAIAVAAIGSVLYVRNVAAARDRADRALDTAQHERDRAVLAQASLLIEKDPARAKDLLATVAVRSPQYALMMSRAQRRASTRVVASTDVIQEMFSAPGAGISLLTRDGELHRIDPRTGARQLLDRELELPVTARGGTWLYARKSFGARTVSVSTPSNPRAFDTGALTGITGLAALSDEVYALDSAGDLYRLSDRAPVRIRSGVHRIAGDGRLLVVCAEDGTLDVLRDGAPVLHRRCKPIQSPYTIGVAGDDYAVMTQPGVLVVSHGGRTTEVATTLTGEHELSLSRTGVVAMGDYERGTPWFVRPGETTVEPGPPHAAGLDCVAAGGRFAAWGYVDGTVIATDTVSGAVWELRGHPDGVTHIAIDDAADMLVSASGQEVRVWDLKAPPVTRVGPIPCTAHHLPLSPDRTQVALDCRLGGVWLWSLASGAVREIHRHGGHAIGVQWLGDSLCSAGWDGKVLCTPPGGATRSYDPGGRLTSLAAGPRHEVLAIASGDGRIWKLDDQLRELYAHDAVPVRVEISPDGKRLASCAHDGSLIVFDLAGDRIAARAIAHGAVASSVGWSGDLIWTAGLDGAVRWWQLDGDTLRLRSQVQEPGAIRHIRVSDVLWTADIGAGVLVIGRPGEPASIRLELGKRIESIDISPDNRHVAVSVFGELTIINVAGRAIATLGIDSTYTAVIGFVAPGQLAANTTTGIKRIEVDRLDYTGF